jgi:hypothetical protein
MKAMREIAPIETQIDCQDCGGSGQRSFRQIDDLVKYLTRNHLYGHEALQMVRDWQRQRWVVCVDCGGKGYRLERR